MHIHGNHMAVNAANFYSTAQNREAIAAGRAAEVRKKLLKGAAETEEAATPEESLLIGKWMGAQDGQLHSQDQHRGGAEGKDPDFG
jgi:hypothetical protein